MLDHPKNDIFIHMDAKTKFYNPSDTEKLVKRSRIFHTRRIKVSWGGYSLIEAELILLEAATSQGHYDHYHLLSGADLPIKRQDNVITFFEEHHEKEFIHFTNKTFTREERVRYYYPFQEMKGRRGNIILRVVSKLALIIQHLLRIHRNKGINFQYGAQWFSITDEFARYTTSKREWIRNTFHDTFCCDEIFIQTLLINSSFCNNLYYKDFENDHVKEVMRLIDWKRGIPYVFRLPDLEEIENSTAMFARKFDEAIDIEIVRKIQELYS